MSRSASTGALAARRRTAGRLRLALALVLVLRSLGFNAVRVDGPLGGDRAKARRLGQRLPETHRQDREDPPQLLHNPALLRSFENSWPNQPGPGGIGLDAELTALNRKVDHAIRSADRRTLVFYQPYVVFDFGSQDRVGALRDLRAVSAWHDYCLSDEATGCSSHEQGLQTSLHHRKDLRQGPLPRRVDY